MFAPPPNPAPDSHAHLVEKLQLKVAENPHRSVTELAEMVRGEAGLISDREVLALLKTLTEDTHGLGPLTGLLGPDTTDIVVNGGAIWVDSGTGLTAVTGLHLTEEDTHKLAVRLAHAAGTRLDSAHPCADGRLVVNPGPLTIRLHAMLAPPSASGTLISLRVLRQATANLTTLRQSGSFDAEMEGILRRIVAARRSFLITGGTGTGKTTLLAALLAQARDERILVIEDTAELAPDHPHLVTVTARHANAEGTGEITLSYLLQQALRMRPDRIVVGEIRGREVVDLLAALNTGHEGGAGTIHANSITEVPARIAALAALGGLDTRAVHLQMDAAIDIVIALSRTTAADGTTLRRISQLGTIAGGEVTVIWDEHPRPGFAEFVASLPQGQP